MPSDDDDRKDVLNVYPRAVLQTKLRYRIVVEESPGYWCRLSIWCFTPEAAWRHAARKLRREVRS